ncbi:MAG: substrate-binding domain-containing protein [Myxococcales bacterium]|nr:substrate-binding domain-containing protein [Myxococcales bacterium]
MLTIAGLAATSACRKGESAGSGTGSGSASAKKRIAVIPKGTTHEFWKSVHAGAVKAARELDVDVIWKGAIREDDLKGQIDVVQSFVAQGVNGIALAPLSDRGLVGSVKAAVAAQVPVVVFDSDLASDDYVSFVATDNEAAGKLAAGALAARVTAVRAPPGGSDDRGARPKRPARVALLRYEEGSASTGRREKGFVDAVRANPELELTSDSQYAGATTETAEKASENLLTALKADAGGLDGVFTPNESTTFGMLLALRKAGLAGKVRLVGFDASDKLVQGLRSGEIDALVVQRPFDMGYLAVKTLVLHLGGKPVARRIDTGSTLVTRDNLDAPEVQAIVSPDLKTWLGP